MFGDRLTLGGLKFNMLFLKREKQKEIMNLGAMLIGYFSCQWRSGEMK